MSTQATTTSSPTLVFVPGSWHRPACYNKIIQILEPQGLRCVAVALASASEDPEASLKDDIDRVQSCIAGETHAGRNVVVIAHSFGGIVGSSAIKGFTRPADDTGAVIGLILIASGFALEGLAFMDPFFGIPPPSWRVNRETGHAELVKSPREIFYHDLPPDEADYWTSQLTPQSLKSLFEGAEYTYAGWRHVPSCYIGTVYDYGLPVVAQRMQIGMARAMGAQVEHRELPTSHSPFLSRPQDTADLVIEAVAAFTGKPLAMDWSKYPKQPQIKLTQPMTWYRYGFAYGFGYFIGKCIVGFTFGKRLWNSVFSRP